MSFDPSATGYPVAGLCLIDTDLHLGEKILEARSAFQIESHLALPDAGEVLV